MGIDVSISYFPRERMKVRVNAIVGYETEMLTKNIQNEYDMTEHWNIN